MMTPAIYPKHQDKRTSHTVIMPIGSCLKMSERLSISQRENRRTIRRVEELKRLYPDYRFVGICIQPYTDMVSQAQNILNLDLSNQYSFQDFEKSSKSWVLTFLNKTIIIDEKSKIIDGFSNLFTNEIEQILNLN